MKTSLFVLCGIVSAGLALAETIETTTVTPVEVAGTLTRVDSTGNSFVVSAPDRSEPVAYGYTKTTTIVDRDGRPVAWDIVKSGMPVTVYYTPVSGKLIASKVIINTLPLPAVEQTTTTTTTTTIGD